VLGVEPWVSISGHMKEELASVRSLSGDRRLGESRLLTHKDLICDFMMPLLVRLVVMGSGRMEAACA
jgi:hypothetical protein